MLRLLVLLIITMFPAVPAFAQQCTTKVDSFEVKDTATGKSTTKIEVWSCAKLGAGQIPGLQVTFIVDGLKSYAAAEPEYSNNVFCEEKKKNKDATVALMESRSMLNVKNMFVKNSIVAGKPAKLRVEVKVKSSDKVTKKDYDLPFNVECGG